MEMTKDIQKDLSGLDEAIGKVVTLHGRLFVRGDDSCCVAASYDAYTEGQIIELDDGGAIAKALLTMLPASGGGDCLYDEECVVSGKLVGEDEIKRLVDIAKCIVTDEEGAQYPIGVG